MKIYPESFTCLKANLHPLKFGNVKYAMCIISALFFANGLFAQNNVPISGTITDAQKGTPIAGVNVSIEGTGISTRSDAKGHYTIVVPNTRVHLIYSYVGYKNQKIAANDRSVIQVQLGAEVISLAETVVIGYGTQKKSDLTGAISSIKASDVFENRPLVSFDQALAGRAAGVQITSASGEPGAGVSFIIRGRGSISSGIQPLYVIDGLPISSDDNASSPQTNTTYRGISTSPLSGINPGDIASVEILKDASATAIYGARGANGVVLITTKKGAAGRNKINFETYEGISNVIHYQDLLDASAYASMVNVSYGSVPPYEDPSALGKGTDWQKEMTRTGAIQNQQLNVSGGTDKVTYFVSGNYNKTKGVVLASDFWRANLKSSLDFRISKYVDLGVNLNASRSLFNRSQSDGTGGTLYDALIFNPIGKVYNDDGTYALGSPIPGTEQSANAFNPVAKALETTNQTASDRMFGNAYLNVKLLPGLTYKLNVGTDISDSRTDNFTPSTITTTAGGYAKIYTGNSIGWLVENTLTYDKTFHLHHLTILGGYTEQVWSGRYSNYGASGFTSDAVGTNNLANGTTALYPYSEKTEVKTKSVLGRINYIFNESLLVTLTSRLDGSSLFGVNNKWGFFPSAAVGYRLSDLKFIKDLQLINNLKPRISYGIIGNSSIPKDATLQIYTNSQYYGILNGSSGVAGGLGPNNIGNSNIKWERTKEANFGLDMDLLASRISFTVDYYIKKTDNLLMTYSVPAQTGFNSAFGNIGSLQNKGLELTGNFKILNKDQLTWTVGGNISFNKNKITYLGEGIDEVSSMDGDLYGAWGINPSMMKIGEPVGIFWGQKVTGIFNNQSEINDYTYNGNILQASASPGDWKFADVNQNGNLDKTKIGDPNPKYIWGLNTSLTYKNFDFSMQWNGVYGNDILNIMNVQNYKMNFYYNNNRKNLNYWKSEAEPGDGKTPRLGTSYSDRVVNLDIEKGTFARLQNASIAYTFKKPNKLFQSAKVYLSGQNLITITDYTGYDPEVNAMGQNPINFGVDVASYPKSRTFIIGVALGL